METIENIKTDPNYQREAYLKSVVIDPKKMSGVWELRIQITNSQGTKAFGGRLLTTYNHPLNGIRSPLVNLNFQEEMGFMIDRPIMRFNPDTNPMDRRIIDWLVSHPEVGIDGVELTKGVSSKKQSNPQITLKNIDRQEMTTIENEDKIDVVIGKLSEDGPKSISLEKLRYLLAYFNLPYFDIRYVKNKTVEKKYLRQKIKSFARSLEKDYSGKLNAERIDDVLSEIENLKYYYEFKEMLRHDIIRENYGIYKFSNVPLGSTEESVILWMKNNLEVYNEMNSLLYPKLKQEGFNFK